LRSLYTTTRENTKTVGVYRTWLRIEPSSLYSLRDKRKKLKRFYKIKSTSLVEMLGCT
jgi:hypothetical protein